MHTSLSFGMLNQLHHLPQSYLQDNRTYPHIQTQPFHPTPTSLYPVELSESVSAYQCIWGTEIYVRHDLTFHFATSFMNPFLTPCTEYGVISDSFTTNTTRIFAGFLNYTGTNLTFHYLCLPYVYFQSLHLQSCFHFLIFSNRLSSDS